MTAPKTRLLPKKKLDTKKRIVGRDFPDMDATGHRKAVCKRCHCVMNDVEPGSPNGEFMHPRFDKDLKLRRCINVGKMFDQRDSEIEPFTRKSVRARNKRNGVRP